MPIILVILGLVMADLIVNRLRAVGKRPYNVGYKDAERNRALNPFIPGTVNYEYYEQGVESRREEERYPIGKM